MLGITNNCWENKSVHKNKGKVPSLISYCFSRNMAPVTHWVTFVKYMFRIFCRSFIAFFTSFNTFLLKTWSMSCNLSRSITIFFLSFCHQLKHICYSLLTPALHFALIRKHWLSSWRRDPFWQPFPTALPLTQPRTVLDGCVYRGAKQVLTPHTAQQKREGW